MRRAELLRVVGIPTTTYSALSNRGLLPFNEKASGGRWNTFVEEHAIRLALLVDLTKAGMNQPQAAALVRDHFGDLEKLSEQLGDGPKPRFLFGGGTFNVNDDASARIVAPIVGVAGQLDAALERAAAELSLDTSHAPVSIVLVDVTTTMAEIYQRAAREDFDMLEMKQWAQFLGLRR